MSQSNHVVVHSLDGKIQKGTTGDFFPNRPLFHLLSSEGGKAVEITCSRVKAVFFVKDPAGDREREDKRGFLAAPGENAKGMKIAVRFVDGELVCGYTMAYSPGREGFFVVPADSASNNIRIYVVSAAAAEIGSGPGADALVQKHLTATRSK